MAADSPVAQSVFHPIHLAHGATMVESDGWSRPSRYTAVDDEIGSVRLGVGIADISPVGKLRVYCDDLDSFLNEAFRQVTTIPTGRTTVRQFTEDSGISDVVEARLADDEALFITAPRQARAVANVLEDVEAVCAHWVNVTSGHAGVAVAGPQSHLLLAAVTETNVSPEAFVDMSCAQGKVAEIHGTVLRRDIRGLLSYELYFAREYGEYMWDALMEAGERYGLKPFGTEALIQLRG